MTIKEYKDLLKVIYKTRQSLIAIGSPGIGKTASVYQVAEELGVDVFYMSFSTIADRTDFRIQYPELENKSMIFLYSEELPKDGKGFLLLDDITDGDKFTMSCAKSLLFERRLSKYNVPDNVVVVATGNPVDSGGITRIDEKTRTRTIIINIEPSVDEWIEWAKLDGINEAIIRFIQYRPQYLNFKERDEIMTPRQWEIVSKVLSEMNNKKFMSEILGSIYPEFEQYLTAYNSMKNNINLIEVILEGREYNLKGMNNLDIFALLMGVIAYIKPIKLTEKQVTNLLELAKNETILMEYKILFMKELVFEKPRIVQIKDVVDVMEKLSP